ncbi:MAG: ABC transporter ATP-binding protein [Thermodesulfobacteriota bacterium]|nr:ABC transporter ATP-binding protein [Thermodesulfobacteriota bacterium]
MILLKAEDIHAYYGNSHVLQGVSLEVKQGEIVALLGRNGAGKTTTLKTLMGLLNPRSGNIFFKHIEIKSLPAYKVSRKGIGYVPQGRHLFPKMTVLENLKTGIRKKEDKSLLENIFNLFPVLEDRLNQKAGTLSGGEQQSLAIARALLTRPEILLLDEATTGLMPIIVSQLKDIIKQLNDEGMAILLVEEKISFALSVCEKIYFIEKGKTVYENKQENLQGRQDIFIRYLGVNI